MPVGKAAGRSASELRRSLETEDEVADPVVRRGRPAPATLTRRTNARGDFRGSRGGMGWKIVVVVLETRDGAPGSCYVAKLLRRVARAGATRPYKATKSVWAGAGVGGVHSTAEGRESITRPEGRDPALFVRPKQRKVGRLP